MTRQFLFVAVMLGMALAYQINHRDSENGDCQVKTLKNIALILCVCSLCSKALIHTYRHFCPPPAAIVGP